MFFLKSSVIFKIGGLGRPFLLCLTTRTAVRN